MASNRIARCHFRSAFMVAVFRAFLRNVRDLRLAFPNCLEQLLILF